MHAVGFTKLSLSVTKLELLVYNYRTVHGHIR